MTLPSPRLHPDPARNPAAAPDDRGDWSLVVWVPVVFAVAGVGAIVRRARHALCGALYRAAEAVNDAPPLPDTLTGDGALWRAVAAPDGRRALLSDREPGPRIGQPGELEHWLELNDPPVWGDFEDTAAEVRWWNAAIRGGAT